MAVGSELGSVRVWQSCHKTLQKVLAQWSGADEGWVGINKGQKGLPVLCLCLCLSIETRCGSPKVASLGRGMDQSETQKQTATGKDRKPNMLPFPPPPTPLSSADPDPEPDLDLKATAEDTYIHTHILYILHTPHTTHSTYLGQHRSEESHKERLPHCAPSHPLEPSRIPSQGWGGGRVVILSLQRRIHSSAHLAASSRVACLGYLCSERQLVARSV